MTKSILREKSKEFAKAIVLVCRKMKSKKVETVLINQLLRSGTSVGANIYEGQYAQGTKDLISKFEISLKEAYESEYWLEILYETGCLDEDDYNNLRGECVNICRMLVSSVKTLKAKLQ